MGKSKIIYPSSKLPIWLSNWVIGYSKSSKIEHYQVKGVIVKGKNKKAILRDKDALRKAVWAFEAAKIETKPSRRKIDEVMDKYTPISVELIKQIGFGINENL